MHVANGEEYEAQGQLLPAAQEFYKAAEVFLACIDQTPNPQVGWTRLQTRLVQSK